MRRLHAALVRFLARQDGPTPIEYAVLLALVLAVCVSALTLARHTGRRDAAGPAPQTAGATGS